MDRLAAARKTLGDFTGRVVSQAAYPVGDPPRELAVATFRKDGIDQFCPTDPHTRFTLQPLVEDERRSLACRDIGAIRRIDLCELHLLHDSDQENIEIRHAGDVFRAFREQGRSLFDEALLVVPVLAVFRVSLPRGEEVRLCVEPPLMARTDRPGHEGALFDWLFRRGFIESKEGGLDVGDGRILAVS